MHYRGCPTTRGFPCPRPPRHSTLHSAFPRPPNPASGRLRRMRKVVVHRPGGFDRLVLETAREPAAGPGEVRVRTTAIGVNFADCVVRMGLYESARKYVGWPITPGFEFAGVIEAAGRDVQGLAPGDRVFGVTRFGAYASHVVAPAHQVLPIPAGLSDEQAAGLSVVYLTAWYALFELANVKAGRALLVHSAAGGVGGALLQLARVAGCRTVGVVGGQSKVPVARQLGATEVIDKSREDLWSGARCFAPHGFDVVLDANGVSTLRQSYDALAPSGRLVIYGFHSMLTGDDGKPHYGRIALDYMRTPRFNPLDMTNANKSVMAFNLSYLFDRRELLRSAMTEIVDWLLAGRIHALPVTTFALDDVREAHRALQSRGTVGKLVLVP